MSDFRALKVYQAARLLNKEIFLLLKDPKFDRNIRDQLSRASTSVLLNLAEGAGRFTPKDKKYFMIVARASALECSALFDIIEDVGLLGPTDCENYRGKLEEVSKMLFGMIRNLEMK